MMHGKFMIANQPINIGATQKRTGLNTNAVWKLSANDTSFCFAYTYTRTQEEWTSIRLPVAMIFLSKNGSRYLG